MGMLSDNAAGIDDTEEPTPVERPGQKPREEEPEPEPAPEPVAVALPKPSRRQAAKEAQERETAERRAAEQRTQQEMAELRNTNARIMAELAARPVHMVQAPQQQQQAIGPDPDALMREAHEALDKNRDYNTWQQKFQEATLARWRREQADAAARAPQQPQQQQIDPRLAAISMQYPEVTEAPNGIPLVAAEYQMLIAQGGQAGFATMRAAFAAAQTRLKGKQPASRPTYDAGSAAVLGGAPTSRGSGGGNEGQGGPAVMLNPDEERSLRALAKKSGMTWEEYLPAYAKANPHLVRG